MMQVSELKKYLEDKNDDDFVQIVAANAPPWLKEFGMRIVSADDFVQGDDE